MLLRGSIPWEAYPRKLTLGRVPRGKVTRVYRGYLGRLPQEGYPGRVTRVSALQRTRRTLGRLPIFPVEFVVVHSPYDGIRSVWHVYISARLYKCELI